MARNFSRTKQLDRTFALRGKTSGRGAPLARRTLGLLVLACAAVGLGACSENVQKVALGYINPRNSLLNPSEVGRFDKDNPWHGAQWGTVRPVKWPILDSLDLIDQPADQWAAATDPTPADLVPDRREFTIAANDAIRITIFGLLQPEQEFTRDMAVNQTGTVTLPYLGIVDLSGLTPTQAQEKLKQVAIDKRVLPEAGNGNPGPQVSVSIIQSQTRNFSVIGQVQRAGVYGLFTSDLRLLSALSQAGDFLGGAQPGLDYIYVIRSTETQPTVPAQTPSTSVTPTTGTAPARNPLDTIESIERGTVPETKPAPTPAPGAFPANSGATGEPQLIRPLPTAVSMSNGHAIVLAQADLDAALSTPAGAAATTAPMPKSPTSAPAEDLLNQAMGTPTTTRPGQYVWIGDKWVLLSGAATQPGTTSQPAPAPGVASTPAAPPPPMPPGIPVPPVGSTVSPPSDVYSAIESLTTQRVIRIPVAQLRAGEARYNIIIRPGDVINVPTIEPGEFYMMGHVNRPGSYSLTGRKITLRQAIAAAGNLDSLAIPRRCELIRRIGTNQEAIVQVNLQSIFDGEQADIFLKPYDVVNVGTDAIAPFLAVTRNAYRLSYGFGFVFDRNYAYSTRNQ
ncbi:MAG: polysaccharide biosynthesis/export family protein [Phycisphaerales bacterium]|nr:polysaccharide biosynthesis/export family protein [Phycisphaerales bacterium]